MRVIVAAACVAAGLSLAGAAGATDLAPIGGQPASVDVTNTSIFNWHFDDRNDTPLKPSPITRVDDNYGEWLDRFNLQLSWWRFTLGLRYDTAVYANKPDRVEARNMAEDDLRKVVKLGGTPAPSIDYTNQYFEELQSRYLRTFYLSKLWLGYSQSGVDVTAGDFYVQLGRGLVFSVRKIDELAIDTTVRGAKVEATKDIGALHVAGTLFGGVMNPIRVDEQTGRRVHGESEWYFPTFPQAGDMYLYGADAAGNAVLVDQKPRPSYLDDSVVGGHLEAGTRDVVYGLNGAMLFRKSYTADYLACAAACKTGDPNCADNCKAQFPEFPVTTAPRTHNLIRNFSGSVTVPSLAGHGDLYVEVAGQQMRDGHLIAGAGPGAPPEEQADLSGYAFYGSASARGGPVTVTLEGKHYRRFFPLTANLDINTPGWGAREFDNVAYSQPPRVESIYTEPIGSPDVCVSGGRARIDYRFTPSTSVYTWIGRYLSWSEAEPNDECIVSKELQTNTWDIAVGGELQFEGARSHAFGWVGGRLTDREIPQDVGPRPYLSTSFYREGYVRYDLVKRLGGPFSVQLIGNHRKRFEPIAEGDPWYEGENYTALQWAPHFAAIFGYEYTNSVRLGCRRPTGQEESFCHYFNGALQWRSASSEHVAGQIFDTVNLFVGQRRAAIRCVAGVCRQFPPFEGAKIEIVSRF